MKILILGVSSKNSVGCMVGEILRQDGHEVRYASRKRKLNNLVCDITGSRQVRQLLREIRPEVVIHAAGVFTRAQELGLVTGMKPITRHVLAKSVGMLALLDAAAKGYAKVQYVIAFGGREVSSNPGYAAYTIANGAMWSALQFANRHTKLGCYFLELPLVEGSTMAAQYLADRNTDKSRVGDAISPSDIARVILEILADKRNPKERVVLNPDWTA